MRDRYEEILATGAGVTAIGTGGRRYAKAFIEDERVPFPVLLDEDGTAAEIAGTRKLGVRAMVSPAAWISAAKTARKGHRQQKTGRRPFQLGATLVIGPGDVVGYSDYEDFAGDHADIDEVLEAVGGITGS